MIHFLQGARYSNQASRTVAGALPVQLPGEGPGELPEASEGLGAESAAPPPAQDPEQAEPHEHLRDHQAP